VELKLSRSGKTPRSLFAKNFLEHWSTELAETDRVTSEELQSELETFAQMFEASFQTGTSLDQSAELLLKLFSLSHKTHQTDKWLKMAPQVLTHATTGTLDPNLRVKLLNRMGQTYRIQGQLENAYKTHQQALDLCQKGIATEDFCFANCFHHLAEYHREAYQYKKALEYSQATIERPSFATYPATFQATAYNLCGRIHQQLEQYPQAIMAFKSAIEIWSDLNETVELARSKSNLGNLYLETKNFDLAHKYLKSVVELNENNPIEQGGVFNKLGVFHAMQGNLDVAIEHLQKGKAALNRSQTKTILAGRISHNLGYAHLKKGDWGAADSELRTAVFIWKKLNNQFELARSLSATGELYHAWGKHSLAIEQFDKVLEILQNFPAEKEFREETLREKAEAEKEAARRN